MSDSEAKPEPDRVARRAIVQFVARSLIALILVGVATFFVASRIAELEAVHDARVRGEGFASGVAAPLVNHALRAGDPKAVARFDRVMRNRLEVGTIAHIKVWTREGTLIWSDEPGPSGAFPERLRDEKRVEFSHVWEATEAPTNEPTDEQDQDMLEVYVGTRDANGVPVVLEMCWTRQGIAPQQAFVLSRLAPLSLGALAALVLLIVPLGISLARRLARTMHDRDRMLKHAARASELECRRMAQMLHDGVIQDLAGLAYVLPSMARHAPELRATLAEATDLIKSDVDKLRSIVADIYPPSLASDGLAPALAELAEQTRRRGIEVTVRAHGTETLDHSEARLAYRVAREGLLNVVRHSGATHAAVSVASQDTGIDISVRDDGRRGTPQIPGVDSGHLGLRILRDVLEDLGGGLTLHRTMDGGTELRASLPQDVRPETIGTLVSS